MSFAVSVNSITVRYTPLYKFSLLFFTNSGGSSLFYKRRGHQNTNSIITQRVYCVTLFNSVIKHGKKLSKISSFAPTDNRELKGRVRSARAVLRACRHAAARASVSAILNGRLPAYQIRLWDYDRYNTDGS